MENSDILECGVAGDVDYIVTGDPDLLKLKEFRGIKIRTAKEFVKNHQSNVRTLS